MLAELIALFKQQLHAEADAKQGLSTVGRLADGPVQAGGPQLVGRVPEGADPREDDPVG